MIPTTIAAPSSACAATAPAPRSRTTGWPGPPTAAVVTSSSGPGPTAAPTWSSNPSRSAPKASPRTLRGVFGPASKARAKLRALVPATDPAGAANPRCPTAKQLLGSRASGCCGLSCYAESSPKTFSPARAAVAAPSWPSSPNPAARTACSPRSGFPPPRQPSHPLATHPRLSSTGKTRVAAPANDDRPSVAMATSVLAPPNGGHHDARRASSHAGAGHVPRACQGRRQRKAVCSSWPPIRVLVVDGRGTIRRQRSGNDSRRKSRPNAQRASARSSAARALRALRAWPSKVISSVKMR